MMNTKLAITAITVIDTAIGALGTLTSISSVQRARAEIIIYIDNYYDHMIDYYKVLGLSNNASSGEIKKAYRSLALIYHPDKSKNPKSAGKFMEILEAFEALYNEVKNNEKGIIISNYTYQTVLVYSRNRF